MKFRFVYVLAGLLLIGSFAFTGCLFNSFDSGAQSAISQASNTPAPTARVRFNLMMTEDASANYKPRYSLMPNRKANATVRFRLVGIQVGTNATTASTPATVSEQVVNISSGTAEGELTVPAVPAVGQAQINGGSLDGFTDLHGGTDLHPGDNVMNISPAGTGMPQDRLAAALEASVAVASPTMRAACTNNNLAAIAERACNNVDRNAVAPQADALNGMIAELRPSTFVQMRISPEGNKLMGYDGPEFPGIVSNLLWQTTNQTFWGATATNPLVYLPSTDRMAFTQILRQGLDGTGYVACQHDILYPFAIARVNTDSPTASGTRINFVRNPGMCMATLVMPDNSVIAGGMNNDTLSPVIFRWDGKSDAKLKNAQTGDNDTNLVWVKYFSSGVETAKQLIQRDQTPLNMPVTRAEPNAGVVAVQWDGAVTTANPYGNLLISVRDAAARRYRIFRLKPNTGDLADGYEPPPPASLPVEIKGTIEGVVRKASDNSPMAGVSVVMYRVAADNTVTRVSGQNTVASSSIARPTYVVGDKTTDTAGFYRVTLPVLAASESYMLAYSMTGYNPATMSSVIVRANETNTVEPVLLTPVAAPAGNITGVITNALTGGVASDVTVNIFRGLNTTTGTVVTTAVTTNTSGAYTFNGLEAGQYTLRFNGAIYATMTMNVTVVSNVTTTYNGAISPAVPAGDLRIVMTWGQYPSDLDSHLFGPKQLTAETTTASATYGRYHIAYWHKTETDALNSQNQLANLDVDDVTSYGPETVTIKDWASGTYRYVVHNYTNRGVSNASDTNAMKLANSTAKVRVISDAGQIAEFNVPNRPGVIWKVFEMRKMDDGSLQIIPGNTNVFGSVADTPQPDNTNSTATASLRGNVNTGDSYDGDITSLLNNLPEK